MANRRSLGDALTMTPDKLAFIQGAKPADPAPVTSTTEPAHEAAEPERTVDASRSTEGTGISNRRSRGRVRVDRQPQQDSMPPGTAHLMAPITTRLQPATAAALKRAGLEQRLRGAQPATVQEIVEIAVASWLEQHDYL